MPILYGRGYLAPIVKLTRAKERAIMTKANYLQRGLLAAQRLGNTNDLQGFQVLATRKRVGHHNAAIRPCCEAMQEIPSGQEPYPSRGHCTLETSSRCQLSKIKYPGRVASAGDSDLAGPG